MEIGLFQIENLINNPMPFRLIDLRQKPVFNDEPYLERILGKAEKITGKELLKSASGLSSPELLPVVIFCDDGKESKKVAARLEKLGWSNVFYLEGGLYEARKELR